MGPRRMRLRRHGRSVKLRANDGEAWAMLKGLRCRVHEVARRSANGRCCSRRAWTPRFGARGILKKKDRARSPVLSICRPRASRTVEGVEGRVAAFNSCPSQPGAYDQLGRCLGMGQPACLPCACAWLRAARLELPLSRLRDQEIAKDLHFLRRFELFGI